MHVAQEGSNFLGYLRFDLATGVLRHGQGPGGYSHIWAIQVRAAEQGMVFEVLGPKQGIFFDPFDTVFLVWSFDRVANLYYLILE